MQYIKLIIPYDQTTNRKKISLFIIAKKIFYPAREGFL